MESVRRFSLPRTRSTIVAIRKYPVGCRLPKSINISQMNSAPAGLAVSVASPRWLLAVPRIAFIAFICSVAALLWLEQKREAEDHRATLISDMLWLEQNIRFQMARNEELIGHLMRSPRRTRADFEAEARTLIGNNSGLVRILLTDSESGQQHAYPARPEAEPVGETLDSIPSSWAQRIARSLGRPVYTAAYPVVGSDWHIEVHVPIGSNQRLSGAAIGIYSLNKILDESVPWWLLERYRVAVIDSNGKEIAARSKVVALNDTDRYQLAFDPPGYGLALVATSYQTPSRLIDRLVMVSIVALAFATLFSLWLVRKHLQQRIRAEGALRKEYLFRQAMEQSLQTGLRARDLTGKIIYVNQAFCRMVGWTAEELIGRSPPMPYWVDADMDETRALHDSILAGDGPLDSFELRLKRKDGSIFTALIHEAPLIDADGRQSGWMSSVIDISDRKTAEETARIQQERLEATARLVAVGEMASTLAHELNQPLAAVSSYSTAALNLLKSGSSAAEVEPALERAVEQSRRAGQIVRRIYGLVKRGGSAMEPVDLEHCLEGAMTALDAGFRKAGIQVRHHFSARPMVSGDPVLLEQAMFNLLRNAGEALQSVPAEQRIVDISLGCEGDYARICIADRGPGVRSEDSGRLFEPLYTTKSEGMGMGLSITRSIVENHRGRLWHEPNPGGGCMFHVMLPALVP